MASIKKNRGDKSHRVIVAIFDQLHPTFTDIFKDAPSTHKNFTLLGPRSLENQRGCVTPLHLVSNIGTKYLAIRRDNVAKKLKEEFTVVKNGPNSFTCPKSK